MTENLLITQLELGDMANFTYIIADKNTREAAVVDPSDDTDAILTAAQKDNLTIIAVLLTHGHYDHVGGADKLAGDFKIPVYLSKHEFFAYIPKCRNLTRTADGEKIKIGELSAEVLDTPGHTPGCQCFLVEGNLFTGDTLFIDAAGRTDFPGGNSSTLFKSLARIKTLPDTTMIWPGHNYGAVSHATLGVLKNKNPFLAAHDEQDLQNSLG